MLINDLTESIESISRRRYKHVFPTSNASFPQDLECSDTEMTLVLPVITLKNINLENIKLNSPTCPVSYNNTHLTAHIPLTGCGTKRVVRIINYHYGPLMLFFYDNFNPFYLKYL